MQVFGRSFELSMIFRKTKDVSGMFLKSLQFKDFGSLWIAYLKQNSPSQNQFSTKDGLQILLSDNLHDAITVMVIFCREDYGKVTKGSTVVDVGANIGVFSLYAARCGAKKIYAFEPNIESYNVLLRNIKLNKLEDVITPFNLAVGPVDGAMVSIPKNSSPYNSTVSDKLEQFLCDEVETISLPSFITQQKITKIDLLKMDCEGAEYQIIYAMPDKNYDLITKFKLEHHLPEEQEKLESSFRKQGFKKTKDDGISVMWFER